MYRIIRASNELESIYSGVSHINTVRLPYVIEITLDVNSNISINSSEDQSIYVDTDIFEHSQELDYFGEELASTISNEYDLTVGVVKINKEDNSLYVGIVRRESNSMYKIIADIGFILRVSTHPQRLPYSDEVQEECLKTQQDLELYVNSFF